jgi:cellulose synthase/poly-beta-1,6-N-acetylglucosamine synthase-like glycosyltransferase
VLEVEIETDAQLRREIAITVGCLVVTLVASALLARDLVEEFRASLRSGATGASAEQFAFFAIAGALLWGTIVYEMTRLGFARRRRSHRRVPREVLDRVYDESSPPALAILIPSYREETEVVHRALLSAALQEHPRRRVVLLIDDPPDPRDPEAAAAVLAARSLPRRVAVRLAKPAAELEAALADFVDRRRAGALDLGEEMRHLAALHAHAAAWIEAEASAWSDGDHASRFFVELVLRGPAREERSRGARLEQAAARGERLDPDLLLREHRRLASLFRVNIACFERKRYANLSHEPNKAMNLNAYIGLLGRRFRSVERSDGTHLEDSAQAELCVEPAEFVLTLDADSVLAPDYALRLMHCMRSPGNERMAVAQTPYGAFPGAPGLVERVAGATTDIQHRIHQGFTHYGATYWVGANALLRTEALHDIRTLRLERGHEVQLFVQDRTVIEDTESSVDLAARGWTLHNVPERLSWSATPPDFGALLIQRLRWANGGLLILPKLLLHLVRGRWNLGRLAEGFLRCHYLVSIAIVNVALLALLLWPFGSVLETLWLPVASIPYFLLYGRDLVRLGYPPGDLLRAYALNVLLLPIQLAGMARSLRQALTGRKSAFARTPKISGRTPAPPSFHAAEYVFAALLAGSLTADLLQGRWLHSVCVAANGAALSYALIAFVGPRRSAQDLRLQLRARPVRDWQRRRGMARARDRRGRNQAGAASAVAARPGSRSAAGFSMSSGPHSSPAPLTRLRPDGVPPGT